MDNNRIQYRQPVRDKDGNFTRWHHWGYEGSSFTPPLDNKEPSYQMTALVGKNLEEGETVHVFEGDVVNVGDGGDWEFSKYENVVVEWKEYGWWPWIDASSQIGIDHICSTDPDDIVIVGNIIQNPELVPVPPPEPEQVKSSGPWSEPPYFHPMCHCVRQ